MEWENSEAPTENRYQIIFYISTDSGDITQTSVTVWNQTEKDRAETLEQMDALEKKILDTGHPISIAFSFVSATGKKCRALIPSIIGFMHNLQNEITQ